MPKAGHHQPIEKPFRVSVNRYGQINEGTALFEVFAAKYAVDQFGEEVLVAVGDYLGTFIKTDAGHQIYAQRAQMTPIAA